MTASTVILAGRLTKNRPSGSLRWIDPIASAERLKSPEEEARMAAMRTIRVIEQARKSAELKRTKHA
jgi:hypothetical protein